MRVRWLLPLAILALAAFLEARQPPDATVSVTPIAESDSVAAGGTIRLALEVAIPEGLHVQSDRPRDPSYIPALLSIETPDGVTFVDVAFPESKDFRIIGFDEPATVFEGTITVGARVTIPKTRKPGPLTLRATFRYQGCTNTACFPPDTVETEWTLQVVPAGTPVAAARADRFAAIDFTRAYAPGKTEPAPPPAIAAALPDDVDVLSRLDRFDVVGVLGYESDAGAFVQAISDAEKGIRPRGLLDGRGPLAILALVFLGGLALNLTPCVLPMIPINLAIIGAGAQNARRGRGFLLGSAYGGAMTLVYGLLGLVVILTAGTFGAINASPWFNFGIALLFVFLGLAMFDVVSLDFSRFSSRFRFDDKSRGTFLLAFGMGAIAALLAGACVAPVVVQVVVFASDLYARGTSLALALPFVLGLGMALPWPLAGAGLSALPKPGAWMVRVKQVMGIFILGTAAYYAYLGYGIVASRWVDPEEVRASAEAQLQSGWHSSLSDGLRVAESESKLAFVDIWATWCKNCLVMDRTTLQHADVTAKLSGYTRIKFQAEDPNASPARELMKRAGAVGLPAYVILRPKNAAP